MKKGILIKRKENDKALEVEMVDIKTNDSTSELHQIYDLLQVDLIDVVSYKGMSIYVDDEGLLKSDPKLTMVLTGTNQKLYGNILILGDVDEEGDTKSVTVENVIAFEQASKRKNLMTGEDLIVW